ncbi:TIR domain-containing protein [soil metagenome]
MPVKRKVFVSYHHDNDRAYYDSFVKLFAGYYDILSDHSVRQEINSDNADYVIRRIRELYLTGASTTIVLCGAQTSGRRFVDWEILSSLNQQMGIVGVNLPTNLPNANQKYIVPDRLHANISTGYASWLQWAGIVQSPSILMQAIEASLSAKRSLIDNSAPKKLRNS